MTPEDWEEIERLYRICTTLPPEERPRFLAEAGADEEIRAKVESLLAKREKLPSFLEHGGLDVAARIILEIGRAHSSD